MTVVLVNVILEPMAGSRDRCAAPTQFGQQLVEQHLQVSLNLRSRGDTWSIALATPAASFTV
jgi:hypothetical protein